MLVTGVDDNVPVMPAALQLARALAREARVILVDCGAEPHGLDPLIAPAGADETASGPGLRDLLAGDTSFAEVIHRDPVSRLHLLAFGSELAVNPDGIGVLVDALAETYDHVVLAVPVPDRPAEVWGADRADLALLLLCDDDTPAMVETCRAILMEAGLPAVHIMSVADLDGLADVRHAA